MGDNQASLPGFPSPRKRSDGDDGDEGARATQARLKVVDRAQQQLRTVDVERLIPEDHPARAIWEFVGRLDLSGYTDQVRSVAGGAGRPAFDPQLLVSLWVYSYSQSVSSARAIERLCEHHPAYQWLTGMQSISAHTLSDFRVTHAQALHELFVQTLGLLSADGLITLERVMLDGTKVRANASSDRFRSKPRVEEFLKDAREAVEALEAQTEEESSRQMQAAKQRARREKQERLESALKEYAKLEAAKSRVKRVSTTDPDARVMKQAEGGSAPSYNVQVSTDAAHGLIVDIDATQAGSDYRQLTPAIERIEQSMQRAPEQMVVDGGYISSNNIAEMAKRGIDFVGPESENKAAEANRRKSYKHHGVSAEYEASKFIFDTKTNTYVCPQSKHLRYDAKQESHGAMRYRYKASKQDCDTCPAKDQCCPRTKHGRSIERRELLPDIAAFRKKMQTDEAKAIYKTRSQVAEFPNLWIKTKFGLRQFSVRGVAKVRTESLWVALTYDLLSGFASAGDRRWYRRSHRRSALNTRSPIRLSTSARDLKFRPLFYSLRQEVLKVEREVTDKHLGEFLNVADVRRAFPAAAMVWKAEGPKIAGLRFATELGVQPGVVGFTAEDSEGLSPFLDAEVVEAAVGVQGALKIRGGRFDVHTRRDAAEAGALRSSGS